MRTSALRTNVVAILATAAVLTAVCGLSASHNRGVDAWFQSDPTVVPAAVMGQVIDVYFHSYGQVFESGKATGTLQVRLDDGESFLYRAVEGQATVVEGVVTELFLVLVRVGEDGTQTGETDFAFVRPSSTVEECLIYDLVGAQIHVEAPGIIGLRHEHIRP